MSGLIKRSFSLAGHRTSVALEQDFWDVLAQDATTRGLTLARMVADIDTERGLDRPLASALRIHALRCRS